MNVSPATEIAPVSEHKHLDHADRLAERAQYSLRHARALFDAIVCDYAPPGERAAIVLLTSDGRIGDAWHAAQEDVEDAIAALAELREDLELPDADAAS